MADKDKPQESSSGDVTPTAGQQRAMDAEQDRGFVGTETDQTPNENYTVAGVTSGKPTPETERGKEQSS